MIIRKILAGQREPKLGMVVVPMLGLLALWQFSSTQALSVGLLVAVAVGNPYAQRLRSVTPKLLATAVVCLGFGMDLHRVVAMGLSGIPYTAAGIACTFVLGFVLSFVLKTSSNTSLLLSVGTGICGGSAIAAVAPVIKARDHEIVVSLATVFILNAAALMIFPKLGHYFELSEDQFGLWSALAIHDTSSVLGASMQFGPQALAVGVTVKLARALWIVPVTLGIAWLMHRREKALSTTIKLPWFIVGFLAASALITWVPDLKPVAETLELVGRRLMVVTLFLVGTSLTRDSLKEVGPAPFVQGLLLWVAIGTLSLIAIKAGLLNL